MRFRALILTSAKTGLDLKLSPFFPFRFFAVAWIWANGETVSFRLYESKIIISKIIEVTQ